jgi:hypothetical protein
MIDNTPPQDATPSNGSVRGEDTFTLTDEEREALHHSIYALMAIGSDAANECARVVRALWDRTK